MGQQGTGKTALVIRYINSNYFANEEDYKQIDDESYRKAVKITINAKQKMDVLFDIFDSRLDNIEYRAMYDGYYRCTQGMVLIFSITDRSSFENVMFYFNYVMRYKYYKDDYFTKEKGNLSFMPSNMTNMDEVTHGEFFDANCHFLDEIPVVLVGTKSDLNAERSVSTEEAKAFAAKLSDLRVSPYAKVDYFEVSAKQNVNVAKMFESIAVKVIQKQNNGYLPQQSTNNKNCTTM